MGPFASVGIGQRLGAKDTTRLRPEHFAGYEGLPESDFDRSDQ